MNDVWRAIANEAGIGAEHMAIGATALSRANYAQQAYYGQAFFALSIGIERSIKLAIVLDHALRNDGAFLDERTLRRYGHDLKALLAELERISQERSDDEKRFELPDSAIHNAIIEILSDFAQNVTRYYNLELLTGVQQGDDTEDPIAAWSRRVTQPILKAHYKRRYRERREAQARQVAELMDGLSIIRHQDETGAAIRSAFEASKLTGETEFAKPWERMYVLQIARFIAGGLSDLGYAALAQQLQDVPSLIEIFGMFMNDDAYLRSRKTWSIYN